MAKLNNEQLALVALPSSSTVSSTCFYAPSLLEAPAPVGAYANGSKSEYADSPRPERVTSHRHASSSPRFHGCIIFPLLWRAKTFPRHL